MENLDNLDTLTAAGLPVYDLNAENIERTDWSNTPLGPRDQWPTALKCLVASCILPIPHCAAIFWGDGLSTIHNLAWGKATGSLDGQGKSAKGSYSQEALSALRAALRGRTVKVGCDYFLTNLPDDSPGATILLSTVVDENGTRQGVYVQMLHNPINEKYFPLANLDRLAQENPAHTNKKGASQQRPFKREPENQKDAKQTQLFRKFAELLPNGLAILDQEAEAVFVNDAFFELTSNKTSNEFRAWPESIDPRDYERVMDAYRTAFSSREELRVEFRCTGPPTSEEDDQWRLFLLRPLSDDAEAGFIAAVVDISEIKRAELTQEKAASEARERKEQQERFIDMVSHEIRNPLSAVLHLAEEIKDVSQEVADKHEDVKSQVAEVLDAADTILLCVSHQNTLVDDILSFSKLDSMMLSLVPRVSRPKWDFSMGLKVFHSEFKAKNISFNYVMDVSYDTMGVEHVVADINRMKQVLVNLITNAIKFTARKQGERNITVSMGASTQRPTSYPPNVIFFSPDDQAFHIDSTMSADWGNGAPFYLMVAVKDTGIGISAEDQAKLFERFRQATPKTQENYGGSGLGLFISRKLCQLHGGDVGVSSMDGEGSTFGFFFKVRRSDGTHEDGRPPLGHRDSSGSSRRAQLEVRPGYQRTQSHLRNVQSPSEDVKKSAAITEQDSYSKEQGSPSQSLSPEDQQPLQSKAQRPRYTDRISSHNGVDADDIPESLKNPPTELREEAHPKANADEQYQETRDIAENIPEKHSGVSAAVEDELPAFDPFLDTGETTRQAHAAKRRSQEQSQSPEGSQRTLLLVEDNLINQKVLRRQLQARGFEVFVANNGQEAIDAVEERGKAAQTGSTKYDYYDCILMDQEMPVKDGNTATIEIRGLQGQGKAGRSPILGVSANVREVQRDAMIDAGMDDIISKPYKVDDLVGKIRGIMPD
ncbi:putative histidine kinase HHK12p [Lophiotrema nucula]|uniref:Putative histidine kinase HHK12p n=1 Tax=Lophiotrema nucula TaxID=690887 RepID=A0A6A5YKM5_9PLEO|nr:putative histidine kinase HHK12p [Lophiotrema nucula]